MPLGFSEAVARKGLQTPWDDLIMAQADGDVSVAMLIKAIIAHESNWNPNAANPADPSYGLMQILAGPRGPYPDVPVSQLLDPPTNIVLGSQFLKSLLARYSQPEAISAYNAGRPITGNRPYVDDVQTYHVWYLNHLSADSPPGDLSTPADTGGWASPEALVLGGSGGLILLAAIAVALLWRKG